MSQATDEKAHQRFQAERALSRELAKILNEYNLTPLELIEITAAQVTRLTRAERKFDESRED